MAQRLYLIKNDGISHISLILYIATDAAAGGKHTTFEYIKESKPDEKYPHDIIQFYMNDNEMDPE